MFHQKTPSGLTGRDGYIVSQALVYAIAAIQNLRKDRQEWSNMRDMCIIARTAGNPVGNAQHVLSVEHHTGQKVTLWPELDEDLSDEERASRDDFVALLTKMRQQRAEMIAEHKKSENPPLWGAPRIKAALDKKYPPEGAK